MFAFHQLDPRPNATNPILDTPCLGVEVTTAALAARCSLGNVDPQHGHGQCSYDGAELADLFLGNRYASEAECRTVEAACTVAAVTYIPPDGSALVTVRPDCDSIAAMAVLVLRRLFAAGDMSVLWRPDMVARVRLIAERDAFVPGEAWAPRALPTAAHPWPTTAAPVSETKSLAPLGAICSPAPGQPQLSLAERVAIMAYWILWGSEGSGATDAAIDRIYGAVGLETFQAPNVRIREAQEIATAARFDLARAVESGEVKIRAALGHPPAGGSYYEGDGLMISLAEHETDFSYTGSPALIAIVESAHHGALGLGYCIAPVVIAVQRTPGEPCQVHGDGGRETIPRKITIAAWRPGLVDFAALREALNTAEIGARCAREREADYIEASDATIASEVRANGWGGGATILGSPQGDGSTLPTDDIVRAVLGAMR